MEEVEWTEADLEETLYKSDSDEAVAIIDEIKYIPSPRDEKQEAKDTHIVNSKKIDKDEGVDEDKKNNETGAEKGPIPKLELDLSGDQIHIIEFYGKQKAIRTS